MKGVDSLRSSIVIGMMSVSMAFVMFGVIGTSSMSMTISSVMRFRVGNRV